MKEYKNAGNRDVSVSSISIFFLSLLDVLQAVAEVFTELFHQAVRPVAGRFETTHEETEYRRFVNELQTTDEMTVVVQPMHTVDYIIYLRQSEYTARYGQAEQFNVCRNFLAVFIAGT
jgi:hypothetical protein